MGNVWKIPGSRRVCSLALTLGVVFHAALPSWAGTPFAGVTDIRVDRGASDGQTIIRFQSDLPFQYQLKVLDANRVCLSLPNARLSSHLKGPDGVLNIAFPGVITSARLATRPNPSDKDNPFEEIILQGPGIGRKALVIEGATALRAGDSDRLQAFHPSAALETAGKPVWEAFSNIPPVASVPTQTTAAASRPNTPPPQSERLGMRPPEPRLSPTGLPPVLTNTTAGGPVTETITRIPPTLTAFAPAKSHQNSAKATPGKSAQSSHRKTTPSMKHQATEPTHKISSPPEPIEAPNPVAPTAVSTTDEMTYVPPRASTGPTITDIHTLPAGMRPAPSWTNAPQNASAPQQPGYGTPGYPTTPYGQTAYPPTQAYGYPPSMAGYGYAAPPPTGYGVPSYPPNQYAPYGPSATQQTLQEPPVREPVVQTALPRYRGGAPPISFTVSGTGETVTLPPPPLTSSGNAASGGYNALSFAEETALTLDGHMQEALRYYKENNPQRAIDHLRKATAMAPKNADVHAALGELYTKLGQTGPAKEAFAKALALSPQKYDTRYALALIQDGDRPQAIARLKGIIGKNPSHADAHFLLGTLYQQSGNAQAALPHLQQAARLNPGSADIQYNLGLAYELSSQKDRAREHYARALRLKPSARDAELALARMRN